MREVWVAMQAIGYSKSKGDLPREMYEAIAQTPEEAEALAYRASTDRHDAQAKARGFR